MAERLQSVVFTIRNIICSDSEIEVPIYLIITTLLRQMNLNTVSKLGSNFKE